jgi:hypothetical protein
MKDVFPNRRRQRERHRISIAKAPRRWRCRSEVRRAEHRVVHEVRVAREEAPPVSYAYHLPEIVPVNEVAVLVYGLCLEQERTWFQEIAFIAAAGLEDRFPRRILHL